MKLSTFGAVSLLLASLLMTEFAFATTPRVLRTHRPNVVWIMAEDCSIHYFQHFFPGGAQTPAIQALAAEGVTFENAYSNAPVCSVARTTLITGCYAPRLATQYHRRSQMVQLPDDLKMFPAFLRSTGYYTTNNRKEDYNAYGSEQAWNESSKKASWRNRPSPETPFFHVQTFTESHESSLHFDRNTVEHSETSHDLDSVTVHPYLPDTEMVRYTHVRYLDRIQLIDKRVSELVAQLKNDDLWENTIVFFFGDHGGVLPRSKGYAYDTGLHVPLVIRIPEHLREAWNVAAGSRDQRLVEFVDFGPTVLSMAGARIPSTVDGDAFLGNNVADDDQFETALGYADRFDEKYDLVRSLRMGRFHYIRNYQPFYPDALFNQYRYKMLAYDQWKNRFRLGGLPPVQAAFFQPRPREMLFDLAADPFEVTNLADNPAFAKTLIEMRERLRSQLKQLPDLSFLLEPTYISEAARDPAKFATSQKARIGEIIDTADTCLTFEKENQQLLLTALRSPDPLRRFWASTSIASRSGNKDPRLTPELTKATTALLKDNDPLVRSRAAETMWVLSGADPFESLSASLSDSRNRLETLWLLNAVVFTVDNQATKKDFDTSIMEIRHQGGEIARRLDYLE